MMNIFKEDKIKDPIEFLTAKGFITSNKNGTDIMTMAYFGGAMKNYLSKNGGKIL